MTPNPDRNDHQRFREWIALALYDELDAGESRELDAHLEHCRQCRNDQKKLKATLDSQEAALPVSAGRAESFLDDLRQSLTRLRVPGKERRIRLLHAAAGFAAGVLFMLVWSHNSSVSQTRSERSFAELAESELSQVADSPPRFSSEPPPAATRGQFARWSDYLPSSR